MDKISLFRHPIQRLARRWEIRYKYNKKHLLFDLLIIGAVAVIIGMLLFWVFGGLHYLVDKTKVKISLQNETISVGQPNAFIINYENGNDFDLDEFNFAIRLPSGFVLSDTSNAKYDAASNVLEIGRLKAGAAGSLTLHGAMWGVVGEKQRLIVNTNYYKTDRRGNKLWGLFQSPYSLEYKIAQNDIAVVTNLPDKAVNGQIWHLTVSVKNGFKTPLNKIFVQAALSENLEIEKLLPQETRKVSADLVLAGAKTTNQTISVFADVGGNKIKIAEITKSIELIEPSLVATLSRDEKMVQPGGAVEFTIKYENAGKASLSNVKFQLYFIGDYWSAREKLITAADYARLALLQPGEKGEISISVGVKKYVPSASVTLAAQLAVLYNFDKLPVEMPPKDLIIPLSSDLSVSVGARYFTDFGEQLGRGPLPPKVGVETKYWIFVRAINNVNDVNDVKVSAELAPNVVWLDKFNVTVGDALVYDLATKQVSWKISKIPAGAENFGFAFEIGLTPTADQKGQYAKLISGVKITGTDAVTGEALEYSTAGITTNLLSDKIGKLKDGRVK